jgi:hypothetical protein
MGKTGELKNIWQSASNTNVQFNLVRSGTWRLSESLNTQSCATAGALMYHICNCMPEICVV